MRIDRKLTNGYEQKEREKKCRQGGKKKKKMNNKKGKERIK